MSEWGIVSAVLLAAAIQGCATRVDLAATGGSRADGVVELSYEAGDLQVPVVDEKEGSALAAGRCKAWGYVDAEPFGGTTRKCAAMSGLGCARWSYSKKYQCMGTGNSSH